MDKMMQILMGLTGMGNVAGQAGNLAAQGMGMADSLFDWGRYFQRNSDPTINDLRRFNVNQFNESPSGPYGDIEGMFGGLFGERDDGSPVQFGDMAARQTQYMMENNPVVPALAQLEKAGAMQRPGTPGFDAIASGDASRMSAPNANPITGGTPVPPSNALRPASPSSHVPMPSPVMTSTRMEGVKAPAGPNPTISAPTPGIGSAPRQAISALRNGETPMIPALAELGGGQNGAPAASMAQRWLQRQGGVPGLVAAAREPGNIFNALADRRRAGSPFGAPRYPASSFYPQAA